MMLIEAVEAATRERPHAGPIDVGLIAPLRRRGLYVHRTNGQIDFVTPATGLVFTPNELYVLYGERPVMVYRRADVYFATMRPSQPPVPT